MVGGSQSVKCSNIPTYITERSDYMANVVVIRRCWSFPWDDDIECNSISKYVQLRRTKFVRSILFITQLRVTYILFITIRYLLIIIKIVYCGFFFLLELFKCGHSTVQDNV